MATVVIGGRCPRCDVCGRVVRYRGVGPDAVMCAVYLGDAQPFPGGGAFGNTVQGGDGVKGKRLLWTF